MDLLPFDFAEFIHEELVRERRAPDHLLHPSSHLEGSLRHAQLDVAGAPKVRSEVTSEITLMTGTLWHEWMHAKLRKNGLMYMAEVNMTPWLPLGWAGTLDALFWDARVGRAVLVDFKTQKGEGMRFVQRDGAKEAHRIQTSIYWHAAKATKLPLAKRIGVLYIPKNDTRNKDEVIEPLMVDFDPIPEAELFGDMARRKEAVDGYLASLRDDDPEHPTYLPIGDWITDALAPVQEREQRVFFDKLTGGYELKLMPHWSTAYCPYADELCDCSSQSTNKIGIFDPSGEYFPRTGYEDVLPEVTP